jgi:hypothetical protein
VGNVADNTPAANDYVALQLDDGSWHFSIITGLSTLTITLTTATPNVTGGGAAAGNILFFFAAGADVDPATGQIDPAIIPPVSATTVFDHEGGLVSSVHGGDPMLYVNANATAASTLAAIAGAFDKF